MRTKWIIWVAIILHYLWGILLVIDPFRSASMATNISGVDRWLPFEGLAVGLLFIVVATMALYGMWTFSRFNIKSMLLMLPQQLLMIVSAGASIEVIIQVAKTGYHTLGAPVTIEYTIAIMSTTVVLAILHNIAILEKYLGVALWTLSSRFRL